MQKQSSPRAPQTASLRLGTFALGLLAGGQAFALDYEWQGVHAQLDSKITAYSVWRVEKRDQNLIGIANGGKAFSTNGDDGNLAWDNGDVVSSGFKLTSDLSLTYGDYGLFTRGNFGWNPTLSNGDLFDPADYDDTLTTRGYTQADRERKESDVAGHVGHYAELLDLYAYTTQQVGERSLTVRVGRQTVNWGESTIVQNGLNSLLALDANRVRVPGFELDEVITPTNQIWASMGLLDNVNLEAFYQLRWERTVIDASGTFWSINDFGGIGGNAANLGFGRADENTLPGTPCSAPPAAGNQCVPVGSYVPRAADVTPKNSGQYGGALRFNIPALNDMELAFYGANYHSRLPVYSGTSRAGAGLTPATTASYFAEYPKDIQMYGLSFNTTIPWDLSLQGEYSYKLGQPLQIDDVELLLAGLGSPSQLNPVPGATLGGQYLRGWRRKDVSQVDIGLTRLFGPSTWLRNDQTIAILELAATHVHDLEGQSVLRYEGPGTYTPGDAALAASQGVPQQVNGYATATSYGYKLLARFDYNNAIGPIGLKPTLRWDHDLHGISPTPITNFVAGRRQLTAGLGFTYLAGLSGEIGYTRYFGAGQQNLLRDRDNVELAIKYAF
ncbi:MAG: DUF1302 domain-containing protein [Stagnimonas sp.]|nr:DUF1302 domain-containing protein [Stagnimonas sp.]